MPAQSLLPFDSVEIDNVGYGRGTANAAKFVPGSGSIESDPVVARVPVDGGSITKEVQARSYRVAFELLGDMTALDTDGEDQTEIEPAHDGGAGAQTVLLTMYGVVDASYDKSRNTTSISCTGKTVDTYEPLEEGAAILNTTGGDLVA